MDKIDAVRFGLAGGITCAIFCFVLTLLASVGGIGVDLLNVMKSIYLGYEISVFGSLVGAIYGFMFGFAELFVVAFIYNLFSPTKE